MRQPRFRKRLEKEHIAEQILTKQIISLPLRGWPPLFHFWTGEKRERERGLFSFFFACIRILPMCQDEPIFRGLAATCKLSLLICGVTSVLANGLVIDKFTRGTVMRFS